MFSRITTAIEKFVEYLIFFSRWLQAPVYLGLVFGTVLYVYKFMEELADLAATFDISSEVHVMLALLGLIDISMVMNLMIIVIIAGYTIFTSRIDFEGMEDKPYWLDHLDADRLKVKLSTSLASISGVHLLKTFIDIHSETLTKGFNDLDYEIAIHMVFIVSALILAWIARILNDKKQANKRSILEMVRARFNSSRGQR